MKHSLILIFCASLFLVACGDSDEADQAAAGEQAGGEPQTWRFALEEIKGSVQWAYAQEFKEQVEQRTDGQVNVEVYPYGTLGTSADVTEQVQQGALQFSFASAGHVGAVIPEVQLFTMHFIFSDDNELNHSVLEGNEELNALLGEAYRDANLVLLDIVPEGWMVWTANRALETPADFEGLKIRTKASPILVQSYEAYGANPTPMPYGEIYGGLQLGQIDAQTQPVFAIEEMSFYEVQSHMIMGKPAQFVSTVIAGPNFIDGLPEERRQMLEEVFGELSDFNFEKQKNLNDERLAEIREVSDIEIIELTEEQREAFRELSMPVRETYVELAGERGEELMNILLTALETGADGESGDQNSNGGDAESPSGSQQGSAQPDTESADDTQPVEEETAEQAG